MGDVEMDVKFGQVDVTDYNPTSGDMYDVWRYPTIIVDSLDFQYHLVYRGSITDKVGLTKWIRSVGYHGYLPTPSPVVSLNKDNFRKECLEAKLCLVEFTDSRCSLCWGRRNVIHEISLEVEGELSGEELVVGTVDVSLNLEIERDYRIVLRGLSERQLFSGGRMYEFTAAYDKTSTLRYLQERLASPLTDLTSIEEYEELFKTPSHSCATALILYVEDKALLRDYTRWAESTRDYCSHYLIEDLDLINKLEGVLRSQFVIKHSYRVMLPGEPPHVQMFDIPGQVKEEWFSKTFQENQFSLVNKINPKIMSTQLKYLKHFAGVFVDRSTWDKREEKNLAKELGVIAPELRKRGMNLFLGDISEFSVYFEAADTINAEVPFLFMVRDINDRTYTPNFETLQTFSGDQRDYVNFMKDFMNDYLEGKVQPTIKSDADHHERSGLIEVVGSSVDRFCSYLDKDILLFMTSSNQCRSCTRYESVFIEFGMNFENPDTLLVGMINVETNDLPRNLTIKSNPPHIVFLPAGRKSPFGGLRYFYDNINFKNVWMFVTTWAAHDVVSVEEQVRTTTVEAGVDEAIEVDTEEGVKDEVPFQELNIPMDEIKDLLTKGGFKFIDRSKQESNEQTKESSNKGTHDEL